MKKFFLSFAALFLLTCPAVFAQDAAYAAYENRPSFGIPDESGDFSEDSGKDIPAQIDKYIEYVRTQWEIPGMAVAFMKDGKLIFAKGFGTKEKGKQEPVDANTVFQVGSVSKSFTGTVMASLVDEGKVKWEDTIKNILPDFKMYDPWVTENMQVKDIMIHRSGLKEQAGTYIPNLGYGREDIYKMLSLMKPDYSFRGDFQYNNITFIIASKIIEKVTGKSWEENVKERVFDPVGMTSSSLNGPGFAGASNVAVPHEYYFDGSIITNPLHGEEQALHWLTVIGPAGSVNSCVNDLVKYARFHMENGLTADGQQAVSKKGMKYLHTGQVISSQDTNRTTLYGTSWYIEQNDRYRVYFHTGTTWGMTTLCFFVPQIKLCGAILVNCDAGASPRYAIMRRMIDLVMDAPEKDYSKESFDPWYARSEKNWKERQGKEKEEIKPAPSLKALAGVYTKEEPFGNATITIEKGELYIAIGKYGFKNKMKHVNGNTFKFSSDGHSFPINFTLNEDGTRAESFEIEFGYGEEKDFGSWLRKL